MTESFQQDKIIFFDGYCILCNRTVDFILRKDYKKRLKFASLQSEYAKSIMDIQINKPLTETVIFYDQGKVYIKSRAVLKVACYLGFPYSSAAILHFIPRLLLDRIYDHIARNRFKWFGKQEKCRLPEESVKDRFIL